MCVVFVCVEFLVYVVGIFLYVFLGLFVSDLLVCLIFFFKFKKQKKLYSLDLFLVRCALKITNTQSSSHPVASTLQVTHLMVKIVLRVCLAYVQAHMNTYTDNYNFMD